MKKLIKSIGFVLLSVFAISMIAYGQATHDQNLKATDNPGNHARGEHYPLIFEGSDELDGQANSYTTSWIQIGYSPIATNVNNRYIGKYNPQYFTVALKIETFSVGDSAQISSARTEFAMDTILAAGWNPDSSNTFIESGSYSHAEYGSWRYESLSDTARRWNYPLKVHRGGYIRLVFETTLADTTTVNWSLICEH